MEATRSSIDARGIKLVVALGPGSPQVAADPVRLEQVFVNLLTNAAKCTDTGGRIGVSSETHGEEIAVRVRDNGIGIAPQMLSRIWELFIQGPRALDRAAGGLGIGLTVAKRLVELHGGRLEAHSDGIGKGAEFVVTLPVSKSSAQLAPRAVAAPSQRQPSARVLLVEDHPDTAETLTMLLEVLGHHVRWVSDGSAALEAVVGDPPEVMIIDIGLPGIDGYEVARRVRRDGDLKHVLLVALTGYGSEEDKRRALDAGFDYHLVKPVTPEALHGLVARLGTNKSETITIH